MLHKFFALMLCMFAASDSTTDLVSFVQRCWGVACNEVCSLAAYLLI